MRWDECSMHAERREHGAPEEEDDEEGTPWPGLVSCLWSHQKWGGFLPMQGCHGASWGTCCDPRAGYGAFPHAGKLVPLSLFRQAGALCWGGGGGCQAWGCPCHPPLPLAPACPPGPTHPHFPELPVAQLLEELEGLAGDLPHVFGFDREVGQLGRSLVARHGQAAAQPGRPLCRTGAGGPVSAWARTPTSPLRPPTSPGIVQAPACSSRPPASTHINGVPPPPPTPRYSPAPPWAGSDPQSPQLCLGSV